MSDQGEIGDIVEIRRISGECSIEWRIRDFFAFSKKSGATYTSSLFNFFDAQWYFRLYPNGLVETNPPSEWINLIFHRDDMGLPKTVNIKIRILGVEKETTQEFSENDRAFCWFRFCTISSLRIQQSKLMSGNLLVIRCDMKCNVPGAISNKSSQTDEKFSEADEVLTDEDEKIPNKLDKSSQTDQKFSEADEVLTDEDEKIPDKLGIEKLSEDIGKLLAGDEGSDITVQVRDVEFKAHRNILSVRSPVLSAMFRHDTEEKASNRITINDCEPGIFQDFLDYIYKGCLQKLSEKNVFGLYQVADKYLADDLKQKCLEHIQITLSVQTFCNTVKLALTHGENDLLQQAIHFAAENIQLIICSVEWQNFICEYPRQANEILVKCLCPRNLNQKSTQ